MPETWGKNERKLPTASCGSKQHHSFFLIIWIPTKYVLCSFPVFIHSAVDNQPCLWARTLVLGKSGKWQHQVQGVSTQVQVHRVPGSTGEYVTTIWIRIGIAFSFVSIPPLLFLHNKHPLKSSTVWLGENRRKLDQVQVTPNISAFLRQDLSALPSEYCHFVHWGLIS